MLVSMLEVQREIFSNNSLAQLKAKKKVGAKEGDFLTLINVFLRYSRAKGVHERRKVCGELKLRGQTMDHVLKIHEQLVAQVKGFRRDKTQEEKMLAKYQEGYQEKEDKFNNFQIKSSSDEYEAILRCILSAYFTNIAQLQPDGTYLNIRSK
jgi:ATP-dependent RNA helicase DDX35